MRRKGDSQIYEKILAHMRDGVVTVDLQGRIITFNAAAGQILGCDAEAAVGQLYAEIFFGDEAFDAFNEVVLKAIYEAETTHSQEIAIHRAGQRADLYVSSSFLRLAEGEGGDEGAAEGRSGVIVVFTDVSEQRKRRKIKRLFGEYVDPRIVEQILARAGGVEETGRREVMTVAFTDMRNFTGWSEALSPDALIALLNRFLGEMTGPVSAAGGITDKFIGDAVMACWGPPYSPAERHAADSCHAMLEQRRRLPALRQALAEAGYDFAARIDAAAGVATGEVVAGDIGAEGARNFTVIGNTVNVAARLQGAAKTYGNPIVASEATRLAAGEAFVFRELDTLRLKGKRQPERIFALLEEPEAVGRAQRDLIARYEAALAPYRAGDWTAAERAFAACLALAPEDAAAALMLRRCRALAARPPARWDGVWGTAEEGE